MIRNLFLILTCFFSLNALAQTDHSDVIEAGFLLGLTNYSGDIAEKRVVLKETKLGYGAFVKYHIDHRWAVRGHFYTGNISGDDANNSSKEFRKRKFRFSTNLTELSLTGEVRFATPERLSNTGLYRLGFSPYFFAGLGYTLTTNTALCYGTEAERLQYEKVPFPEPGLKSNFISVPLGFGFSMDVLDRVVLGAEMGWRPVFSDDLDGIKTNGNPDRGDWYYFFGASLSYYLTDPSSLKR